MTLDSLTKKTIETVLPENIYKSELLDADSKRLLATLLYYTNALEKAKEAGFLYINNFDLIKALGWKYNGNGRKRLNNATFLLEFYNLIKKVTGKKWVKGEKPIATEYHINQENLCKPIVKSPCGLIK